MIDPANQRRYLSAPDAARYLCVSLSWLRKATMRGQLPHAKLGVRVVYDREDLDEFIRVRKVDAGWTSHDRNSARAGGES